MSLELPKLEVNIERLTSCKSKTWTTNARLKILQQISINSTSTKSFQAFEHNTLKRSYLTELNSFKNSDSKNNSNIIMLSLSQTSQSVNKIIYLSYPLSDDKTNINLIEELELEQNVQSYFIPIFFKKHEQMYCKQPISDNIARVRQDLQNSSERLSKGFQLLSND